MHSTGQAWLFVAFCSTVATSFLLATGGDQLTVTQYNFSVIRQVRAPSGKVSERTSTKTLYIAPDGRQRTDSTDDASGHPIVQIVQPEAKLAFVLDAETRTYYRVPLGARLRPWPNADARETPSKDLGSKTIHGLSCHAYGTEGQGVSYEVWRCVDPASGVEVLVEILFPGLRQLLQEVTTGIKVPKTFFDIPADFRLSPGPLEKMR